MPHMQSLWMLVAAALFALMGLCVKLAGSLYSVPEIVFYRCALGAAGLLLFARLRGGSLRTTLAWMHLRRGVVGTASLTLWFYATTVMPLGTAMTLNYTSPLFLAAFTAGAALAAGQRVDWRLAAAVGLGFVGVVLALSPSVHEGQTWAALGGLASGVLSAIAYWHVRELGRLHEPEWRTVFYFSLAGAVLGLAGTLFTGFAPHSPRGLLLLFGVALFATTAQLAMTRAFGKGSTLLAAALQYSAIVFASGLGVLVFGDTLPPSGWAGIGIIVVSGVAATVLSSRAAARERAALATTDA
ncbi:MAG: hypothetical protein RL669_1662 [Pseudomonadota bacterium]|jgi:S-adenosylmethionine uptake transporter